MSDGLCNVFAAMDIISWWVIKSWKFFGIFICYLIFSPFQYIYPSRQIYYFSSGTSFVVKAKVNTTVLKPALEKWCVTVLYYFLFVSDLWRSSCSARRQHGGLPPLRPSWTVNSVIIHSPYSWLRKTVFEIVDQKCIFLINISLCKEGSHVAFNYDSYHFETRLFSSCALLKTLP